MTSQKTAAEETIRGALQKISLHTALKKTFDRYFASFVLVGTCKPLKTKITIHLYLLNRITSFFVTVDILETDWTTSLRR